MLDPIKTDHQDNNRPPSQENFTKMEGLYHAVFNALGVNAAVIDHAGNILEVNQSWRDFAQANGIQDPDNTVVRVNYMEVLRRSQEGGDATAALALQGIEEVLSGDRASFQMDYPCQALHKTYWFTMKVMPFSWNSGGAVIIHENITEEKLAEQVLRQSEAFFRLIFEKHDAVMLLIEPVSGAIVDANLAAQQFYGYPLEILRKMHIQQINVLPPEEVAARRQQALRESLNFFVFPHRLANGEVRQVEVHSSPITIDDRLLLFSIIYDVTARQQAEAKLQASEKKFVSAFQNSPDALVISRAQDGLILDVNESWETITGFSREESLGRTAQFLGFYANPDERRKMLSIGSVRDLQMQIRQKSGALRWISISADSITLQEETCFLAILHDIEEQKQIQDAIRAERDFALQVMNTMGEGLTVVDSNFNFEYVNPAYAHMLGLSAEEILQRSPGEVTIPEDLPTLGAAWEQRKRGEVSSYEIRLRHADGHTVPVHVTGVPRWNNNHMIGSIAVVTNLSERKQAEELLRASESKFARLFQNSPALVTLAEQNTGIYFDVNERFLQVMEYSRQEVIGRSPNALGLFADQAQVHKAWQVLSERGRIHDQEMLLRTKSGRLVYGLYSAEWIHLQDRRFLLVVTSDITERKQAEDEINAQLDELRRWNKAAIGREMRMVTLKQEVNELLRQAGQPPRYPNAEAALQEMEK
jgi:PAS domain S-box-containing protein